MKMICIGAGSMAESMIHGWINKRILKPEDIGVTNRSDMERLEFLKDEYGVRILCEQRTELRHAEFVLLAMKPKDVASALEGIRKKIGPQTIVVSVVAGVSIATIQKHIGDLPVARAMPNTSAQVGKSATGVAWSKGVTPNQQHTLRNLLSSIGNVTVVEESQLDAVTGVAGSGPAYLYLFAEAMVDAAKANGLSEDDAKKLVRQTFAGAADMIQQEDFGLLRKRVTSPSGTTAAGIEVLESGGFRELVTGCVTAASNRSKELGKEFE
ncbi:pyrroline-5-carboxylate reductase [Planomicrobium sp. YIM 101495]|uniref:pyrroline-5-carboxylate reductase n=1 Tax=Planomicrobium sp. YIM 101495 TaxID=2665160 RepID=UPI0012B8B496|nr:pyrroline-5-carboxylate reductase [Planomicrobium sp. YIM 101495]MTD29902.1 pyrroline-5-carboxylate reductase [Planomicrobium sp. YIM 101495]